jgi:2-methylaconitate cis-trans-isomerase PrpF
MKKLDSSAPERTASSSDEGWPWDEGTPVRCSIWRGGTSRAAILRARDLPPDEQVRDRAILALMGSPDPRQIDGLGGAHPLTSKVAIVEASSGVDADVDLLFGQVAIDRPLIDYSGTCGNISAAIGPWAIHEGIVEPVEPITKVRVINVNSGLRFVAHIPVRGGRPESRGGYVVSGAPRPGAPIRLEFLEPGGAVTGSVLPTGRAVDDLSVGGITVRVSIVDAGNPTVFIRAEDLGVNPDDVTDRIRSDEGFLRLVQEVRETAGRTIGLVGADGSVPSHIPKIVVVADASRYERLDGSPMDEGEADLRAWALTMGRLHQAFPVTGGMATAVAARYPGTVVSLDSPGDRSSVRIGHPSGVLEVEAVLTDDVEGPGTVERIVVTRTARRLMSGDAFLP